MGVLLNKIAIEQMKPIKLLILLLMAGMPLIGIGQTEVPASQVKEEIKRVEKENEKEAKEAARKVAREEQKNAKTEWDKGVTTSIAFSQVSFTNWAAGGDGNLSLNGFANLHANLKKGIHYWNNSLNLGYGLIKNNGDINLIYDELNKGNTVYFIENIDDSKVIDTITNNKLDVLFLEKVSADWHYMNIYSVTLKENKSTTTKPKK